MWDENKINLNLNLNNHKSAKGTFQNVPFQNGGQKTNFQFAKIFPWPKFEKKKRKQPIFPKEFFNEIWLKVGEHEYIYIFEMKFKKKNILFKNGGKNKFYDITQ